jgi:hypothetical protein
VRKVRASSVSKEPLPDNIEVFDTNGRFSSFFKFLADRYGVAMDNLRLPNSDAHAGMDELVASLNELLEAERAGARVTLETARQSRRPAIVELMQHIQHDEARWCAMLLRQIRELGGTASPRMGAFYEKAMAIEDVAERIAFLNRGQGWVVRKLRELIPRIHDAGLSAGLHHMLSSHVENITLANSTDTRALSDTAP